MTTHTSRTALVTGASRGLGLALARQLAAQGWQLIIDARGANALESALAELSQQARVIAVPGDVTDAGHRHALVEAAQELGGLDALVNNASFLGPSPQPNLLDYPLDVLEQVYRANVIAPLALIQDLRHQLKPGACVMNITSDAGVEAYAGWVDMDRARQHSNSFQIFSQPKILIYVSTGLIQVICARRCTRRLSPARISAIGPCPKRACRVCLN